MVFAWKLTETLKCRWLRQASEAMLESMFQWSFHQLGTTVSLTALMICPLKVSALDAPHCKPLSITVEIVEDAPEPYRAFCEKNGGACELTGPSIVAWTTGLHERLRRTNASVNDSIKFLPDRENSGLEEIWNFPHEGVGDCEDFVLEKRRQLVGAGLPSASMTCAIAFHQVGLFAHAVLMVETTAGTFVLDNLDDDVMCWDAAPYFYTRRERPDGLWTRFQQP